MVSFEIGKGILRISLAAADYILQAVGKGSFQRHLVLLGNLQYIGNNALQTLFERLGKAERSYSTPIPGELGLQFLK